MLRLQYITQAIAQQVKGQAGEQDRAARNGGNPPLVENHLHTVSNHRPPFGHWRTGAEAKETQPGGGQNNPRQIQR